MSVSHPESGSASGHWRSCWEVAPQAPQLGQLKPGNAASEVSTGLLRLSGVGACGAARTAGGGGARPGEAAPCGPVPSAKCSGGRSLTPLDNAKDAVLHQEVKVAEEM